MTHFTITTAITTSSLLRGLYDDKQDHDDKQDDYIEQENDDRRR